MCQRDDRRTSALPRLARENPRRPLVSLYRTQLERGEAQRKLPALCFPIDGLTGLAMQVFQDGLMCGLVFRQLRSTNRFR